MTDHIDIVRLSMISRGDDACLRRIQHGLRMQEEDGDIRIVFMDDEIAKIQFLNTALARVFSGNGGRTS